MARATFAPSLDVIRVYGAAACLSQLVVTIVFPTILWYQVYRLDPSIQYLAYATWAAPSAIAIIGVAGHATAHTLLLALHAVLAVAVGAGLGAVHTSAFTQLLDRCAVAQVSFVGCSNCTCALYGKCTKALILADPTCVSCKAMGVDVCQAANNSGLLGYMGLACLLAIALPALPSLQVFCRVEVEASSISNRLQYARNVVSRELTTLQGQHKATSTRPDLLEALTGTLLAYGQESDKEMAMNCVRMAGLDLGAMAASIIMDKLHPDGQPGEAVQSTKVFVAKEVSQRMLSVGSVRSRVAPDTTTPNRPTWSRPTSELPLCGLGALATMPPQGSSSAGFPMTQVAASPARSVVSVGSVSLQQRLPANGGPEAAAWASTSAKASPQHWASVSPKHPQHNNSTFVQPSLHLQDPQNPAGRLSGLNLQVQIPTPGRDYALLQPAISPTAVAVRPTAGQRMRSTSSAGASVVEDRPGPSPLVSPSGRSSAAAATVAAKGSRYSSSGGQVDDANDGGRTSRGSKPQRTRSLKAKVSKKTLFAGIQEAAELPVADDDGRLRRQRTRGLQGPPGALPSPTAISSAVGASSAKVRAGRVSSNGGELQPGPSGRKFASALTM